MLLKGISMKDARRSRWSRGKDAGCLWGSRVDYKPARRDKVPKVKAGVLCLKGVSS